MKHKIITSVGYGNTGSSVVTNLLEEFSNVLPIGGSEFEFLFIHEADGLMDLYNAFSEGHRLKIDTAIKRFITLVNTLYFSNPSGPCYSKFFNGTFLNHTKEFLSDLGIISWDGYWHRIYEGSIENHIISLYKNKKFKKALLNSPYSLYEPYAWTPSYEEKTTMFYSYATPEDFIKAARKYLNSLFDEYDKECKYEYLMVDQLLPPYKLDIYTQFFEDIFAIVIDRDPRDLYFANEAFWNSGYIPSNSVESFIKWIKLSRNYSKESRNVLYLNFEDFIYCYEKTTQKIFDFIGISKDNWTKKKTCFIPEKSITNTRTWLRYELSDEDQYIFENIQKIESELKDFLFDYSEDLLHESFEKKKTSITTKIHKQVASKKVPAIKAITSFAVSSTKFVRNGKNTGIAKQLLFICIFPVDFLKEFAKSVLKYFYYKFLGKKEVIYKSYF